MSIDQFNEEAEKLRRSHSPANAPEPKKEGWLHKLLTHGSHESIWQNPFIKGGSYTIGVCLALFLSRLLLYGVLSIFDRCIKFVEFMSSFNLLGS